jgi:hypothetical protein
MIRYASVPGLRSVFALGCFEPRVTIYSQQVRALNLAYSLLDTGSLLPKRRLAVVGGGFAGLTLAAAAAQKGAAVTLFERMHHLLPVQAGCHARAVHPRIFDWPAPESSNAEAGLPLLTWRAGLASAVARTVLDDWTRTCSEFHVTVMLRTHVTQVGPDANLTWRTSGGIVQTDAFDCAVVCAGFGQEQHVPRYWDGDSLEQAVINHDERRFLVSGLGDGAIADVLRLRLGQALDPLDQWLSREFLPRVPPSIVNDIRRLERDVQLLSSTEDAADHLDAAYSECLAFGAETLRAELRLRLRPDTEVVWVGRLRHPYDRRATPLNRFLVACLTHANDGGLSFQSGDAVPGPSVVPDGGGGSVSFSAHRWVPRHGARTQTLLEDLFGAATVEILMTGINSMGFDAPRTPIWPEPYFSSVESSLSVAGDLTPRHPATRFHAVIRRSVADEVFSTRTISEDAAIRSELGFGLHATEGPEDAAALARAFSDAPGRVFTTVAVRVQVGTTISPQELRARDPRKPLELLASEHATANPDLFAVVGEVSVGGGRFRVHCVLARALAAISVDDRDVADR